MTDSRPIRVLILGGGFGGIYTALELERRLRRRRRLEVTLVSRDNFFLFTPMLHEVAASDLDLTHIVNPLRKLLARVRLFIGEIESIDLERRSVTVWHGADVHHHELPFDHLVLGLGSTTNFFELPGVAEHAMTMKSLADAIAVRNRIIANLEEADFECCADQRTRLLTFVVAGGGFAGAETAASIHDFAREALRFYRNLGERELRVIVVHSGDHLLPELGERLGRYAEKKMSERGLEVRLGTRVASTDGRQVLLSDGSSIRADTLIWTAGTAPSPILADLPCAREQGRVSVDRFMRVQGHDGVWAVGDCACIRDERTGRPHPPTAQHALREGRILAQNILAAVDGRPLRPFRFRTIGQLASLGRRSGVARILGINFSGFAAWWLWRTIYLSKLPRLEKKCRVALDWSLDLFFSKDLVQFKTRSDQRTTALAHADAPHREQATAPVSFPPIHEPRREEVTHGS